jgi:hypothetical protein
VFTRWVFFRSAESFFGDLAVLAFLCAQAGDGVLTYVGLAVLGPQAEGNPLLAALMSAVGAGPALAGVKLMASSLGIALHLFGAHRLLATLTLFYFGAALVPWTAILWFGLR